MIAVLCAIYTLRLLLLYFVSQSMERLPYDHRRWITAISITIVAIVCDRVLRLFLVDVHEFVLGTFVALITLVAFVKYSVIVISQALLDKPTPGKQPHANQIKHCSLLTKLDSIYRFNEC